MEKNCTQALMQQVNLGVCITVTYTCTFTNLHIGTAVLEDMIPEGTDYSPFVSKHQALAICLFTAVVLW